MKLDAATTADAMTKLDRAIASWSESVSARTLRGKLLLEEQQPKAAVADLELAHRTDPGSRSATYHLARAYFALGGPMKPRGYTRSLIRRVAMR